MRALWLEIGRQWQCYTTKETGSIMGYDSGGLVYFLKEESGVRGNLPLKEFQEQYAYIPQMVRRLK